MDRSISILCSIQMYVALAFDTILGNFKCPLKDKISITIFLCFNRELNIVWNAADTDRKRIIFFGKHKNFFSINITQIRMPMITI
jgi:hypothetical protein